MLDLQVYANGGLAQNALGAGGTVAAALTRAAGSAATATAAAAATLARTKGLQQTLDRVLSAGDATGCADSTNTINSNSHIQFSPNWCPVASLE
ncbi:MAG: hypothetical protein AB7S38_40545 [Vulcanimicrobiota bacterium]